MKRTLIAFALFAFLGSAAMAQAPNTLTKQEKKEGWKLLFDGKTTQGWHTYLKDSVGSKWQVKDGALTFDPSQPKEGGGDIVTNDAYENYELALEWKISKGGNSGIIFDVQEEPQYGATYLTGPEMQVLDNIDAEDNKKENHLAGCLYDMAGDASVSKPMPVGEWNKVRILQNKGKLTFWLNGVKTYEGQIGSDEWNKMVANSKFSNKAFADFAKVAKGKIALQEHPGSSQWRNIKIRPL
ncbi:3-keto-disaccharide hydrolase [Pontibacter chitinilyticus]|uniref:3-keto-disaccharide hydrolase n=1 Tax=Pontibacter chitinilyticus TaxID=2674989 RepID=UPI00321B9FC7